MDKTIIGKRTAFVVFLSFTLMLTACTPKASKTTKITGQFVKDVPDSVRIIVGDVLDTVAVVTNGCFEVEVPTVLTRASYLRFGNSETDQRRSQVAFVADGSNLAYEPETRTVTSSDKKGLQARFAAFNDSMERIEKEYETKLEEIGDDEAAVDAYTQKVLRKVNRYILKTARANRDNVLGAEAIWWYEEDDPKAILSILESFSPEMQAHPDIINMKETLSASLKAEEGSLFVDFTVVQDPDHPETSTVKFSDYIGKGKYVLVDFWFSACQPCWDVMPKLINVYNTYHGDQFDMLSVAVMDPPALSKESASQMGIVWNQIVNAKLIPFQVYGIDYAPYFMLFGPNGTLLKKGLTEKQIEKTIKKALGV